jgi:ATP-dependent Clp protease adaptor protein ClpS
MPSAVLKKSVVLPSLKTHRIHSPKYKVLLHKDRFNNKLYVSKVISKIIPNLTHEEAEQKFVEAQNQGVSLLTICPQEEAEIYCEQIRTNSCISTIEPE